MSDNYDKLEEIYNAEGWVKPSLILMNIHRVVLFLKNEYIKTFRLKHYNIINKPYFVRPLDSRYAVGDFNMVLKDYDMSDESSNSIKLAYVDSDNNTRFIIDLLDSSSYEHNIMVSIFVSYMSKGELIPIYKLAATEDKTSVYSSSLIDDPMLFCTKLSYIIFDYYHSIKDDLNYYTPLTPNEYINEINIISKGLNEFANMEKKEGDK